MHDNKLVTTAEEEAEALASQYETVLTEEDKSHMPEKGPSPYTSMDDIVISTNGIIKLHSKKKKHFKLPFLVLQLEPI